MSRTPGALAILFLAPVLVGCGQDESPVAPIAPADLAAEISAQMAEEVGVAPEVVCPAELPAELGASSRCTIAASEDVATALVVVATVTEVDTEERVVVFDIAVSTADEATVTPEPTSSPTGEPTAESTN
ncbi:MAG: DUF4333 domain-containing protein [Actinomycetota bacterium]